MAMSNSTYLLVFLFSKFVPLGILMKKIASKSSPEKYELK
jgi:hypothetical protein